MKQKQSTIKRLLTASAFSVLSLASVTLPAAAKNPVGYDGSGSYAGVRWRFGTTSSSKRCPGGRGRCASHSPSYTVTATIIKNGKVTCKESQDFSHDTLNYGGKWYWVCGQPAIIHGNYSDTMRAYYKAPNGTNEWVDSPAHCTNVWANRHCDHYWYVNW